MSYIYLNRRGTTKSLHFEFFIQPGGLIPGWNPARPEPTRRYKIPQYA